MAEPRASIWETMRQKGYSRREFLKFCNYAMIVAGVESVGISRVVRALETTPRPPVLWLHFQECTCCSESFILSSHPIVADVLFDYLSLDYTETLQAAAGHQAEACLHDTMKNYPGKYILLVEGGRCLPAHPGANLRLTPVAGACSGSRPAACGRREFRR